MFLLVDLILASPLGLFILTALQDTIYAVLVISDCDDCGFNDLGKLLFGGVVLSVLIGIIASLVWQRVFSRDSHSQTFVTIRSVERKR